MSEKKVSFWRIFWPSLIAAITVSILGWGIWALIIGSALRVEPFEVASKTVLHMTLDGQIGERTKASLNPTELKLDNQLGLATILFALKEAKSDDNIDGVFLEIDNLNCGMASAREIRNAINDFEKSGKFVVAYNGGEMVSMKNYYLTSAANETYGFPSSNMEFLGLGGELMFFKGLLDKLEIEMQVIRGSNNDFKSAVEPFFRTNASDSSRMQTERYMTSMWQTMREDIAADRNVSIEKLNDLAENASIVSVSNAVKNNLIDATKYRDEVLSIIAKKIKVKTSSDIEFLSFSKYAKERFYQDQTLTKGDAPNIAVILAEGDISRTGEGLTSEDICKLLKEARENKTIKTVVLRVNSPGGSALASDEIWREVQLTNDKKEVIVSMGDLAASGGYFIAAPGTTIFAEPNTITGSIGVFGVIPYIGAMLENKLGISFDPIGTNTHSVMSLNRRLSEDERRTIQQEVDKIYDRFKEVVAIGRGMTLEQVGIVARGRVWTGTDALKIGLIDQLGGLQDAIAYAAKKAGISKKKVLFYPIAEKDNLTAIIEAIEESTESIKIKNKQLPESILKYYGNLKKIESISGIQMRMPLVPQFN